MALHVASDDQPARGSARRTGPTVPLSPAMRQALHTGPPGPPEPPDVGPLVRDFNAENRQHEDLWTRLLHAVDAVRGARKDRDEAEFEADDKRLAHLAVQAEDPQRRAHRLRQLAIAGMTVALDAVACNLAAQALGDGELATLAWNALFLAVLAGGEFALDHYRDRNKRLWWALAAGLACFVAGLGVLRYSYLITVGAAAPFAALVGAALFTAATGIFVAVGYWALRRAETPHAARTRRVSRRTEKTASAARERAAWCLRERDRLADAYVVRLKARLLQGYPASELPGIEAALRGYLTGEKSE